MQLSIFGFAPKRQFRAFRQQGFRSPRRFRSPLGFTNAFALLLLAESGGLNGVFYHLIASQPKAAPFRFVLSDGSMGVFHHLIASLLAPQSSGRPIFRPLLLAEFGGLKWTRTIDLTLIRRVL